MWVWTSSPCDTATYLAKLLRRRDPKTTLLTTRDVARSKPRSPDCGKPPPETDNEAVAHDQHADHQLRIDRWTPDQAIKGRKVLPYALKFKKDTDLAKHMIGRGMIVESKITKQRLRCSRPQSTTAFFIKIGTKLPLPPLLSNRLLNHIRQPASNRAVTSPSWLGTQTNPWKIFIPVSGSVITTRASKPISEACGVTVIAALSGLMSCALI